MVEVRYAVLKLLQKTFDDIDKEMRSYTFKKDGENLIKSAKVRFALKHLRQETLSRVASIGKEFEPEITEEK